MIDVTLATYEQDVIEASFTTPVLVDFWAPWCTPCKTLIPLLEKLDAEYAGRFTLAKVNIDESPQLASMFGVRSVPTCILMKNGQPVDGFMGAQPESQLRAFLDKHLAAGMPAVADVAAAGPAPEELDDEAIVQRLQHEVNADPANDNARFDYIKLLLQLGRLDEAQAAFAPAKDKVLAVRKFGSLQHWLDAIASEHKHPADMALLDSEIAADKRDFAARYARAQTLFAQQEYAQALDELLEILMRDKAWDDGKARKAYIAILDIMEPPRLPAPEGQVPEEDPAVATYRRRLSSVVLS